MKNIVQQVVVMCFVLGVNLFAVAQTTPNLANRLSIEDFGEPNLGKLKHKIVNVKNRVTPPDSVLRISQLGDSHTAADIFTGQLRQRLQSRFGGAGIGWISPINVYGQRNTQVYYTSSDWLLTSSRNTPAMDYPMGGFIATPTETNAQLTVNYNIDEKPSLWRATFLVKQLKKDKPLKLVDGMNYETTLDIRNSKSWQYVTAFVMLPFTLTAESADSVELGGIWLEKNSQPGVVVSPIALNGAKQSIWQQWRSTWLEDLARTKSDLVILAYGTNESFEGSFNAVRYKQYLTSSIKQIRKKLPNATILIVSPPDSMLRNKLKSGASCKAMQPPQLASVRLAQQQVAQQQHTLYWDWSAAMGGDCSMQSWVNQGLANKDYVHLTAAGYQQSADTLYNALMQLLSVSN